jgi:hypothetical protein
MRKYFHLEKKNCSEVLDRFICVVPLRMEKQLLECSVSVCMDVPLASM